MCIRDRYTLYLKTHNFHWNVTGPMFNTLHLMFMGQYTELWNAVDPIAERIRMVELHQQRLVLLPEYFATRTLLEECFKASGAEPIVVAEMSTIAPMLGLVLRTEIAAIASVNAVPAAMSGLQMIPIESPTPIRTPGMLWKLGAERAAPVQSFAVIVRKIALGNSLRRDGPG